MCIVLASAFANVVVVTAVAAQVSFSLSDLRKMILSIPCGIGAIRFYERPRGTGCKRVVLYRAAWSAPYKSAERVWGKPAKSIEAALGSIFGKMKVRKEEREAVWAEASRLEASHQPQVKPAISHKSGLIQGRSTVAFFKKQPFQGTLRHMVRQKDGKVRMALSRKGQDRVLSNWHGTREEAFEHIRRKCISMKRDEPAISHRHTVEEGVEGIHQIYGLYRDGKEMSELFKLSAKAWEAYARREQCDYKLWGADEVDALMQQEAPYWVLELYRGVRMPVQRADVARFFILYHRGGLYADLDTFPNIDRFPKVPLGLCKMQARETKTRCKKPAWEIAVIVAGKGNTALLQILQDMKVAFAEKERNAWYLDKPCRFIYRTTGSIRVGKTLEERGYQPRVTVFSMCRPVEDLEKMLYLDSTGRVRCQRSDLQSYDVLSAFSMSYSAGKRRTPPPLAAPLPPFVHQRPPPPLPHECKSHRVTGLAVTVIRRRVTGKKPELKDAEIAGAEVDHQNETALVQQDATQPEKCMHQHMQPGYQPQAELHQSSLTQVERSVLGDMTTLLFLKELRCVSVDVAYSCLREETRAYIRSFRNECD